MKRNVCKALLLGVLAAWVLALAAPAGEGGDPVPVVGEEQEVTFAQPKTGKVIARTLNCRVGPSTGKELITTFKRDREVKVVGSKGKWLKIELPTDISVWIVAKYVTIPEGQDLPTTGTVNANKVRLRAKGDLKSPILKHLERDTQLEVADRSGDWFKVKAPAGTYAWVHGNYIRLEGAGDTQPGDTQPGDTRPGDTRPGDTQPGDTRPGDTQPGDTQPKKPDPKKPPEVIQPGSPGVKEFSEAEAAYRRARAEKNPDLVKVFLMYYEASRKPGVAKAVKARCESRMTEIARRIPGSQRKRIESEVRRQVEARLRAIDAAAEAAKEQIPKVAPKYTAVGFLDKAPDVPGIPGTHKLSMSGVLLFYLRAAGKDVDLAKFLNRKVGVIGRKRYVKGWGIQVIDVDDLLLYKEPPRTSARLEAIRK
jgi:hypothetical protein